MPEVTQGVEAVLAAHDQGVFDAHETVGAHLSVYAAATARIVTHWERACLRRGILSPFDEMMIADIRPSDIGLNATQLIITTAASLSYVLSLRHGQRNATAAKWAINGIKYYGPTYTHDFVMGNDQRDRLGDAGEQTKRALTVSQRANVIAHSPQALIESLAKVATNLEPSLDDIARELGWNEDKTARIFTQSARRNLAYAYRDTPFMDIAKQIRYLYDEVVAPEALAVSLGITPLQVETAFPSSVIHNMVMGNPYGDIIGRLKQALVLARHLTLSFDLSYSLALWLASYVPKQAEERAVLITEQRTLRPSGVSQKLWDAVVARSPRSSHSCRVKRVTDAQAYWNFLNMISLDTTPASVDETLNDTVPDYSLSPEQLLFGDAATSNLRDTTNRLFDRAGLSASERRFLIEAFSETDTVSDPNLVALLNKIRAVASG